VTSVRELGGLGLNLRRGTEDGSLPLSPHIYAAGFPLSCTGGHGDFHDLDVDVCLTLSLSPSCCIGCNLTLAGGMCTGDTQVATTVVRQ
jgi:hypothetical protein